MTQCSDIRERLTLYLDNELQGEDRASFETHLQSCEACTAQVKEELSFLNAVRDTRPLYSASPELRASVENILTPPADQKVSANQIATTRVKRPRPRFHPGLAIAAALLLLVLPVVVWRALKEPTPASLREPSSFALMAANTHLRRTRGQLPLEMESEEPGKISDWFSNK